MKYKWQYRSPELAPPADPDALPDSPDAVPVKANAKRTVHRVGDWYIKRERSFRNKAKAEFAAARLLEQAGIPCVHFAAYGTCGFLHTILISRAENDTVSALEYFFTRPERRKNFLAALKELMRRMKQQGIRHDDFHAGNVLVRDRGEDCELILVDPVAVRAAKHVPSILLAEFAGDFLPELTEAELEDLCSAAAEQKVDAPALAQQVRLNLEKKIAKQWEKREKQILSGSSKFLRTVKTDDCRTFRILSTRWYAPGVLPADFNVFRREIMSRHEADSFLLTFFRDRLTGKNVPPLVCLEDLPDGNTVLYFQSPLKKQGDCAIFPEI